jgi:tRNA nucleotidyltransferase (CCA-adding enzyme)
MQRYGFEGYPVVVNGSIVGLLNRRNVDRALSHKLSVSASSLMDAGNISVHPDDSLDTLTKVMASSGWGQIPVVDPQSGEIVGIATRTDLIKSRSTQKLQPSQTSIVRKLRKAIPLAHYELLSTLAREADQMNLPIYIVGGFVRDLLLGRNSVDFDIVVEGDAIYFVKQLVKSLGGRFVSHNRFGTAKWYLADDKPNITKKMDSKEKFKEDALPDHLDLITARTEFYDHPAALPTIESSSIKMDLHRRDFTINTLALRLDGAHFGKIFDFWGGLSDLNDRKIRVLHALSFVDDATRLLRAVRFEQRFEFEIEERTLALMIESLPLLDEMTGIRLLHELELILLEDRSGWMFNRLEEIGILHAIHPDLQWNDHVKTRINQLDSLEDPTPWEIKNHIERLSLRQVLGLMFLLLDVPKEKLAAIAERLRLNARFVEDINYLNLLINDLPGLPGQPPSQVNQRLTNLPRLVLYAAYTITQVEDQRSILKEFINKWSKVKPMTDGNDLNQLGLDASPKYTEILSALKDAWLDGRVTSEAEEKTLLDSLLKDHLHP